MPAFCATFRSRPICAAWLFVNSITVISGFVRHNDEIFDDDMVLPYSAVAAHFCGVPALDSFAALRLN
jgi:hypothetical protein